MNPKMTRLAAIVAGFATLGVFGLSSPAQAQFPDPNNLIEEAKEKAEQAGRKAGREARELGQEAEEKYNDAKERVGEVADEVDKRTHSPTEWSAQKWEEVGKNVIECSSEGIVVATVNGVVTLNPQQAAAAGILQSANCNLREANGRGKSDNRGPFDEVGPDPDQW